MKRLELSETFPTVHFHQKREARGIPWSTVRDILKNPSVVEVHNGRYRYIKGDHAIVVALSAEGSAALVTLLLCRQDKWTDEDMQLNARRLGL